MYDEQGRRLRRIRTMGQQKIHTRVGAELAAIVLGILIFIDDYSTV